MVLVTGKSTIQKNIKTQPTIADINASTVDDTYAAEEEAVLGDLRTKFNTLLAQLEANGILASS